MSVDHIDHDEVTAMRTEVANLLDRALTADDPEMVVRLWWMVEAVRDDAARAVGEIAEHAAKVLAGHNLHGLRLEGLPPVVRYTPKTRTGWDKDSLFSLLQRKVGEVDRLLSRDGEVEGDAEVALRLVKDTLSVSGGKVTGLKKLGADPAEFCTETTGVERIRVETL